MKINRLTKHLCQSAVLASSTLGLAANTQAADIASLTITAGEFRLGVFTPSPIPFAFVDTSLDLITAFETTIGWDVNTGQTAPATGSVVSFDFSPFVNTFLVACDPQEVDDCINNPHTAVTGTVNGTNPTIADGDPIVVDMNSFYANWNGTDFNQGGTTGDGTAYPGTAQEFSYTSTVSNVVGNTFDYDMTWQSTVVGGPFDGQTGVWTFTGSGTIGAASATTITAAVLPSSRSVEVGTPATAFATIINSGTGDATGCGIAATTVVDAAFQYQTTDASNALTGSVNTPADILAGQQQNYVFAFTPNSAFAPTDVELAFDCADTDPATVVSGLNTLLLSASATPVADIVALAATLNNDGYADIPGDTGTGVFAVAAVNVGSTDTITASSTLSGALPVTVSLCETDAGGACLAAPTSTVTTSIANGATPSFAAFVTGSGTVADDPAANRITVQFEDAAMVVRGATSVAARTVTP